jgi:hypothetical protein
MIGSMRTGAPAKIVALGLAVALATSACVSTRVRDAIPSGSRELGGVQVTVFADDDARAAGRPGPDFVAGQLERREGRAWQKVFQSLGPKWSVVNLPPGKYRVRYTAQLDERGHARPIEDEGRLVRVRAGEVARVETTLEHVPTGWIVAGVVTVIVAAILLEDVLDDLPTPPLPPLPDVADAIFEITVDAAYLAAAVSAEAPRSLPPVVTSHFPEDGALVAAPAVRIVFAASEPLNPRDVDPAGITVFGEASGLVPGRTVYDAEHWWLVWEGEGELPRGETLRVTLGEEAIEDLAGNELTAPVSFSFRTVP